MLSQEWKVYCFIAFVWSNDMVLTFIHAILSSHNEQEDASQIIVAFSNKLNLLDGNCHWQL